MLIKVNNLSFSYRKDLPKVINDISLEIKEGTVNVLLGLNGCGKTTLIKLLAGLLIPSNGNIQYDDKDLRKISMFDRSKTFAYVSQTSTPANEFKVLDYLTYGFANSLKFYQSPKKEQIDKAKQISDKLHITHLLDKNLGEISGGERQIVSIASALLQDTPVILLDEPSSALDLKNQSIVISTLKEIAKEGKTIILSSHNPNHALLLESNVILMNHVNIVKVGDSKEIITPEILKDVYGDNIIYSKDSIYKEITFR